MLFVWYKYVLTIVPTLDYELLSAGKEIWEWRGNYRTSLKSRCDTPTHTRTTMDYQKKVKAGWLVGAIRGTDKRLLFGGMICMKDRRSEEVGRRIGSHCNSPGRAMRLELNSKSETSKCRLKRSDPPNFANYWRGRRDPPPPSRSCFNTTVTSKNTFL